jgi:SPOR domain
MAMSFPGESDGPAKDRGFADADQGFAPSGQRDDFANRFEETGELDLGDDDVRLPWLEGDDDGEFDDGGSSTGQLIALVLLGLVALGLIAGGVWWWQRDRPDEALVADGATIKAPDTPYKTKPANPGGDVVAGTGDTSFAVAEGQTRQVRMGSETAATTPSPAVKAEPSPTASASAAAPSGAAADMSGPGVQVGAYSNRESAEAGWSRLSQQYEALSGMRYRIVEGRVDIGTVYRLQAVPGDAAAANRLCATLKSAGLSCQVKR